MPGVDGSVTAAQKTTILNDHNKARAAVKPAPKKALPKLKWNTKLASHAQSWVNKCKFDDDHGNFGSNAAYATGSGVTVTTLINLWINEKKYFKDQKISAKDKDLHYTQMVWAKTTSVGCGIAHCKNLGMFMVCDYLPTGNYIGERPYTPKSSRSVDFDDDYQHMNISEWEQYDVDLDSMYLDELFERTVYESCTANDTCASAMAECGTFNDGCEDLNCGTCSDPTTTCVENNCLPINDCVPVHTMESLGRTCGSIFDGCTVVNGTDCAPAHECLQGVCVPVECTGCDDMAVCVEGKCVCRPGYTGDGSECDPIQHIPGNPNEDVTIWENNGDGHWVSSSETFEDAVDGLTHLPSGTEDLILWTGSDVFSTASKVSVSATFFPDSSASFGLAFRAVDPQNYYFVGVQGEDVIFGLVLKGKSAKKVIGYVPTDTGDGIELRVIALGQKFVVYVDGKQIPAGQSLQDNALSAAGKVGIYATGSVNVTDVTTAPVKNIKLHFGSCVEASQIQVTDLANILKVQNTQITQILPIDCDARKRAAAIPGDITFELAGSNAIDADGLQSSVSAASDLATADVAEQGVILTGAESVGTTFLVESAAISIGAGAATGLSTGAIAGIVVGSAIGVAAIAGATVYVVNKKRNAPAQKTHELDEMGDTKKPKGAGANVMANDRNAHQSITMRAPPQAV